MAGIVTGGDSGIGRAVALAFAMEGADLVIVYHTSDVDAAETKRLVGAQGRQCLLLLKGDVSKKAECEGFVSAAVESMGRIDVLVNNAAFLGSMDKLEDISEETLRQTFDTNVFGYIYMAQAALPHLERVGGVIVNTSSTTAILGKTFAIPYASSKGAINVMTKCMAIELVDRGVRVNAVVPGPFWTPPIAQQPEEVTKAFGDFAILKRAGQPEEIATAYVYLATSDSSFVTGMLMEVSGGFRSVD